MFFRIEGSNKQQDADSEELDMIEWVSKFVKNYAITIGTYYTIQQKQSEEKEHLTY